MAGWTAPKSWEQMKAESEKAFRGVSNAVLSNPNSSAGQISDVKQWAKQYNMEPYYDIEASTRDPNKDYKVQREKTDLEKTLEQAYDFELTYGKDSGQSPTQAAINVGSDHWFSKAVSNVSVVVLGVIFVVLAFLVSDMGRNAVSKVKG